MFILGGGHLTPNYSHWILDRVLFIGSYWLLTWWNLLESCPRHELQEPFCIEAGSMHWNSILKKYWFSIFCKWVCEINIPHRESWPWMYARVSWWVCMTEGYQWYQQTERASPPCDSWPGCRLVVCHGAYLPGHLLPVFYITTLVLK